MVSHFTDEEITAANKHMKKKFTFLVIKNVKLDYTEKQFTTSNKQRLTNNNSVLGRAQWHGLLLLLLGE